MPRIIENLREKLVEEAKRQVQENGYAALTIRSVATACGVGVGTMYNYFNSKDALVAAFMLEDWKKCMDAVTATVATSADPEPVLRCMHEKLLAFIVEYQLIFVDEAALSNFSGAPSLYHSLLRSQLAQPLAKYCQDPFSCEFVAESMLTWTVAGRSFEDIYGIIQKIL